MPSMKPRRKQPILWRSFDELAANEDFRERIGSEFPRYAPAELGEGFDRRRFLELAGSSIGLAGLAACTRQPRERMAPYVEQPENVAPGEASHYATAMPLGGYGVGLIAESHMGRPTKLAGNPTHPFTAGGTSAANQAAILTLYDPDRSKSIQREGRIRPWDAFLAELEPVLRAQEALEGAGLRVLTPSVSSPSLAAQIAAVRTRFPQARWVQYEPVNGDVSLRGSLRAFGAPVTTRYDLTRAQVLLALDADVLGAGPGHLRYARDFAAGRRLVGGRREMNRLYVLESTPSITGSSADHRLAVDEATLGHFAVALAQRLGVDGVRDNGPLAPELERWLEAVTADLQAHRGASAVIPGEYCSAELHVLAHAINEALGNRGSTVLHTEPVLAEAADQEASLNELVDEMNAGTVDALLILGGNPVYEAPADLDFAGALGKVNYTLHLGLFVDETGRVCRWHVPQTHFLESWGDVRSLDGTLSVIQPLILPLYEGRSDLEVLSIVAGAPASDYELVRSTWLTHLGSDRLGSDFEAAWRRALHDGFLAGSVAAPTTPALDLAAVASAAGALGAARSGESRLQLSLRPDPVMGDGQLANNAWLQELPHSISTLTWDNAALLAPRTAEQRGLDTGDVVRLLCSGREVEATVFVQPGQAAGVITLHLGYGRRHAGRIGDGVGANAYAVRTVGRAWSAGEVEAIATGRRHQLAVTQEHYEIETRIEQASERHLVKHGTLERLREDSRFVEHIGHHTDSSLTLFADWKYPGYSWGMVIDLTTCTGCSACVVACQAENNIPVVGREQVLAGREMHWLRIDRYYEGDPDQPAAIHHQPIPCMHCERAPCEVVCPVAATVHGPEGLNQMVYNRCVGTRYCSNNCPYKVRRFNFFKYADTRTEVLKLGRNPNVTVRARGVMEKCTYCVQRINGARIAAKRESRKIRDGEVLTACQEACPSEAIAFGDLNDPGSEVRRWKSEPTNYELLAELNTAPRTTFLARITNPNPALAGEEHADATH